MPIVLTRIAEFAAFPAGLAGIRRGFAQNGMTAAGSSQLPGERQADTELVRRMALGDKQSCADLYDRFSRSLYSVALRILTDKAEAEDVVQDVFVALWEKAGEFDADRGSAFGWAITLTRNRAIDRLRTRRRRGTLLHQSYLGDIPGAQSSSEPDSADDLIFKEKAGVIRAALATLPGDQLRAVELAFFSGLTQQEIASELSEPLGTIKARIRRGLLKLRDSLTRRDD